MAEQNHSDRLEDKRFVDVRRLKKKDVAPKLSYFFEEGDYFSEEVLCLTSAEVSYFERLTRQAFDLITEATETIISQKQLSRFGIPAFFQEAIVHAWNTRTNHPFLLGRFDINDALNGKPGKIIEFNADTCTTIPETIFWQQAQAQLLSGSYRQYNYLKEHLSARFTDIKGLLQRKHQVSTDFSILGSSLGHPEDVVNTTTLLDIAYSSGFTPYYAPLEEVIFSEKEGIFLEQGNGNYIQADVWLKLFPWDWIVFEEPELGKLLADIICLNEAIVLNPPYTMLWQNKQFMAYITEKYPANALFCPTFVTKPMVGKTVKKPIYGRLGENISVLNETGGVIQQSTGDFQKGEFVYQQFMPLATDSEKYDYQIGMFYTDKPSALNLRCEEGRIITNDCEFMTHVYQNPFG